MSNLATITNNILADSGIDDINVIVSTGSYANPAWITSLAWTKITGAPSGIVTGTGTTNYLPKFTGSTTIGNSIFTEVGGNTLRIIAANATLRLSGSREYLLQTVDADGRFRIYDQTAAIERVTLTSSGNILIGATADVASGRRELVIRGALGSLLSLGNNTTADRFQIVSDSGENALLNNKANTPMVLYTNATERMRITSTGNVLIGTTTDGGYKLDVNGFTQIRGGSSFAALILNDTRSGGVDFGIYNGFPAAGDFTIRESGVGNYLVIKKTTGEATFSSSVTASSIIRSGGTSSQYLMADGSVSTLSNPVTGTGAAGQVSFWNGTTTQTGDNDLFWDNTNKRLGVGTNSPKSNIDILGSTGIYQRDSSGGSIVFDETDIADASTPMSFIRNIAGALQFGRANRNPANGLTTGSTTSWQITNTGVLQSNGAQTIQTSSGVLTIQPTGGVNLATTSGNVGIGTTSPNYKLQVDSGSNIAAFRSIGSGQNNKQIVLRSGGDRFIIEASNASDGTDTALAFHTGTTERMRITSSGNVGIGTTTPDSYTGTASTRVLAVGTTSGNNGVNVISGTTSTGSYMFSDSGGNDRGGLIYFHTADLMTLNTAGAERMRITSTGNVGIGTSSPVSAAGYTFVTTDGASGGGYTTKVNGTTAAYFYSIGNETRISEQRALPLVFETTGAERMRITSGGNVGIGATSPIGKLNINTGLTGITQDIVNQASGTISFTNNSGGTAVPTISGKSSNNVGLYLSSATPDVPAAGVDMLFDVRETDNTNFTTLTSSAYRFGRFGTSLFDIKRSGNVLIGTTFDNGARLQVSGSGSFINSSTFQGVFSGWSTTGVNTASGAISLGNNAAYRGVISYAADGNTTFSLDNSYDSASAIMRFRMRTAGTAINALTILGSGNVGIGTDAPSRKLDVNGTAQIGNLTTTSLDTSLILKGMALSDGSGIFGDYAGLVMFANTNFTATARRYLITNSLDANKFAIIRSVDALTTPTLGVNGAVSSGIADFVITNSGNVGIGTTAPDSRIHAFVSSGSIQTLLKLENGSATASSGTKISFTEGGAERAAIISQINTGTTPYLSFENNGSERLRITSTGAATFNLGSGEMRLNRTGTSEFLKLNTYYLLSDGNDQWLGSVTGSTSIYAGNGVSPRVTITSSGNVLIGSPPAADNGARLQVSGDILPATDNTGVVGNSSFTWANGQFTNFLVDSTLSVRGAIDLADSDILRFGSSDDAYFVYNGTSNFLELQLESAATEFRITDNGTSRFTFAKSTGNLTATGTVTASNFITTSDRRLKSEIKEIKNAISILSKFASYEYVKDGKQDAGFIAQEVKEVIPYSVFENNDDILTMSDRPILAYIHKAILELNERINKLEK